VCWHGYRKSYLQYLFHEKVLVPENSACPSDAAAIGVYDHQIAYYDSVVRIDKGSRYKKPVTIENRSFSSVIPFPNSASGHEPASRGEAVLRLRNRGHLRG
jgi:hypothetical protein